MSALVWPSKASAGHCQGTDVLQQWVHGDHLELSRSQDSQGMSVQQGCVPDPNLVTETRTIHHSTRASLKWNQASWSWSYILRTSESSINNTGQLVQLGPTVQVKLSTAEVARMPSDVLLTGPPFELKAAIAGTVWRLSVPLGSASLVFCMPGNPNTPKETAFLGWFLMSWPSMMSMHEVSSCRVAFY